MTAPASAIKVVKDVLALHKEIHVVTEYQDKLQECQASHKAGDNQLKRDGACGIFLNKA